MGASYSPSQDQELFHCGAAKAFSLGLHAAKSVNCWKRVFHLREQRETNQPLALFRVREILRVCSFAPSLTGLGVIYCSAWEPGARAKSLRTRSARQKACHKIHPNPCIGQ